MGLRNRMWRCNKKTQSEEESLEPGLCEAKRLECAAGAQRQRSLEATMGQGEVSQAAPWVSVEGDRPSMAGRRGTDKKYSQEP